MNNLRRSTVEDEPEPALSRTDLGYIPGERAPDRSRRAAAERTHASAVVRCVERDRARSGAFETAPARSHETALVHTGGSLQMPEITPRPNPETASLRLRQR